MKSMALHFSLIYVFVSSRCFVRFIKKAERSKHGLRSHESNNTTKYNSTFHLFYSSVHYWRHDEMYHLFCLFSYFLVQYLQSFHHIHTVHSSVAIRRGSSHLLIAGQPCGKHLSGGAEPRIELGPALQKGATMLPAP